MFNLVGVLNTNILFDNLKYNENKIQKRSE